MTRPCDASRNAAASAISAAKGMASSRSCTLALSHHWPPSWVRHRPDAMRGRRRKRHADRLQRPQRRAPGHPGAPDPPGAGGRGDGLRLRHHQRPRGHPEGYPRQVPLYRQRRIPRRQPRRAARTAHPGDVPGGEDDDAAHGHLGDGGAAPAGAADRQDPLDHRRAVGRAARRSASAPAGCRRNSRRCRSPTSPPAAR